MGDDIEEQEEVFTVLIAAITPDTISGSVQVLIHDDDGKAGL